MKVYFERMLEYNHWANTQYLDSISAQPEFNRFSEATRLMSHILNATAIWLARIEEKNHSTEVWEEHDLEYMHQLEQENHRKWKIFLSTLGPDRYDQWVAYSNTQGKEFKNTITDILAHVFNHSTYHRAQIARLMSGDGIKPPVTDFIAFARK